MSAPAIQELRFAQPRETAFRSHRWVPALQVIADLVAVELALVVGIAFRVALRPWFSISLAPAQVRGIGLCLLALPLSNLFAGLYTGYGLAPVERLRRRCRAHLIASSWIIWWGYLLNRETWSRGVLLMTLALAAVVLPLVERALIRALVKFDLWGMSVIVFGTGDTGQAVAARMSSQSALGLVPILVVETDSGAPWSGAMLASAAEAHLRSLALEQPRVAVIAMPSLEERRRHLLLETLPFRRIILMPEIPQIQTHSVTTVEIGGALALALNRNLLVPWNRWLKRALDCAIAALLLIAGAPVIAACALWIRCASKGPVFYSQERLGHRNLAIRVLKLRTMHRNAERELLERLAVDPDLHREWESSFKLHRDPRIVPGAGRFLRRTSLDELPQLWNVLRGDMSLIGPRPFPAYHLQRFDADFQRLRACVRPGMTGLWQVSARSEGDLETQKSLDTYYIRNWSLWLDFEIAIRTLRAVVRGRGAY